MSSNMKRTKGETLILPVACVLATLCIAGLPGSASASMLMFHGGGDPGDRELYFTNFSTIADRTPMDAILGPTSIRQIEVIGVYEGIGKPDWSATNMQFECPADPGPQWPAGRKKSSAKATQKLPSPLRWRVGERSYQFTRDADEVSLPSTQWQPVSDAAVLKAGMFACNELLVRSAMHAAAGSGAVDSAKLNAALAPLGIGPVAWIDEARNVVTLANLAWTHLWKAQKPRGKRDRVLSDAEIEKNRAELARIAEQMDKLDAQALAYATPIIEADKDEQDFLAVVGKVRAGR